MAQNPQDQLTASNLKELLVRSGWLVDPAHVRRFRKLGASWPDVIRYSHHDEFYDRPDGHRGFSWSDVNIRYARRKGCHAPLLFAASEHMIHEPSFYGTSRQQTVDRDSDGNTVYTDSEHGSDSDSDCGDEGEADK